LTPSHPFQSQPKQALLYQTSVVIPRVQLFQKKKAQLVISPLVPTHSGAFFTPLILVSGSLVASATLLGRGHRTSPLAQLLACHFFRRYLIQLAYLRFELLVRGGIGLFSAF
jgi:hypothetical protein